MDDKIIENLTASYLRETLDPALLESCLAFRCRRADHRPPTTRDALKTITKALEAQQGAGLFVAECDIKGFFDCVSHPIAREALGRLIADAQQQNPSLRIEPRALQIFEAYLACYSFQTTVLCGPALESLKMQDPDGEFNWHEAALRRLHGTVNLPPIGVPQGAALSCLIANAVLHPADKALKVLEQKLGRPFTYMRYCDDMILLAPNRADCAGAFREYRRVLRRLRLAEHQPQVVRAYNAKFWSNKSNFPYRWAQPPRSGVVPWIQFVGYQVRYDGLVRIRPKSLRKQRQALSDDTDSIH